MPYQPAISFWGTLAIGVALGGIAGFLASLLANAAYAYLLRPVLEIDVDPGNPDPTTNPSQGPEVFFHARVTLSDQMVPILGPRRAPRSVLAYVTIKDINQQGIHLDSAPARWVSWPEPLRLVPVAQLGGTILQPHLDTREIARQKTFEFQVPGQKEQLDVAYKVEGQDDIYFWNNSNYRHGAQYPPHRLPKGHYEVSISLLSEGRRWTQRFRLSNEGRSWRDVRLVRFEDTAANVPPDFLP